MNNTCVKPDIKLRIGMHVTGKWHKNHYLIHRKLGSGTVGTVYLCESNGKKYALKISKQSAAMTVEVNVLKALRQAQGYRLGPSLIDVDDLEISKGHVYSFYVMEYIKGDRIDQFIQKNGAEWIGVLMLQLLGDLQRLHNFGWVFGDLKIEHLIVQPSPPRICFMDVGGTTQIGRAIKEYTEFYDRGYWGLGSRRAEPSYDLFSFAMIFIAIFYPNHFSKTADPFKTIHKKLTSIPVLHFYQSCLSKAILGKYASAAEMKRDLMQLLYTDQKRQEKKKRSSGGTTKPLAMEMGGILLLSTIYYFIALLY